MFFCGTGETDNKVELCEHHMTCFKFRFRHLDLYIFCIFLNVVAIIYLPQSCRRRYNFFQNNIKLARAFAQVGSWCLCQ